MSTNHRISLTELAQGEQDFADGKYSQTIASGYYPASEIDALRAQTGCTNIGLRPVAMNDKASTALVALNSSGSVVGTFALERIL